MYLLNDRHSIGLGYAYRKHIKDIPKGVYPSTDGTTELIIRDGYTQEYVLSLFELLYSYQIMPNRKHQLSVIGGVYYLRMRDQDIYFFNQSNQTILEERNAKTYGLQGLGANIGLQYGIKIHEYFYLNIESKLYYEITTGGIPSHISITPGLKVYF